MLGEFKKKANVVIRIGELSGALVFFFEGTHVVVGGFDGFVLIVF